MSLNPDRRLAKILSNKTTPPTPDTQLRTALVRSVDSDGTCEIEILAEDGSPTAVPGVRFVGATPQAGRQVSYMMSGTEPVVVGETGTMHDPVFQGRVVADSFHAMQGGNLLPEESAGWPWDGWQSTLAADLSGDMVITRTTESLIVQSPLVEVTRPNRHYTCYVTMPDSGGNASAYVMLQGFDAGGASLGLFGSFVDQVRAQGQSMARYPMPEANYYMDDEVKFLQLVVVVTSGTGNITIEDAFIGTAPVFEGGAVLLGRTHIDQAGIRLDGEDLLAPWTETAYAGCDSLAGGTWTVRHRRIGKTVNFTATGNILDYLAGGAFNTSDLPLPYIPASNAWVAGALHEAANVLPVTGTIVTGSAFIARVIQPVGYITGTSPYNPPHYLHLSGVYEAD